MNEGMSKSVISNMLTPYAVPQYIATNLLPGACVLCKRPFGVLINDRGHDLFALYFG